MTDRQAAEAAPRTCDLCPDCGGGRMGHVHCRSCLCRAALVPDSLDALRALSEAATPGPWSSLTHGTASQRDAAGRAYEAVMAVRAKDNPDIQFTDLSWVDTTPDGPHIALGNGPTSSENAKFIVAAVNYVRAALREGREPG